MNIFPNIKTLVFLLTPFFLKAQEIDYKISLSTNELSNSSTLSDFAFRHFTWRNDAYFRPMNPTINLIPYNFGEEGENINDKINWLTNEITNPSASNYLSTKYFVWTNETRFSSTITTANKKAFITNDKAPGMAPVIVPILFFVAGTASAIIDGIDSEGSIICYSLSIATGTWSYFKYIRPKKRNSKN